MLVAGVNDDLPSLERIKAAALKVRPNKIQLNTVTRVPAEMSALRIPRDRLEEIKSLFGGGTEIIADYPAEEITEESVAAEREILEMLDRRPCSLEDIVAGLRANRLLLAKQLERLEAENKILRTAWGGKLLYRTKR
jgi:wyosine [tRNA(Phe)-imidazoG37] synthetase (radical SAM superfamily)